MTHLAAQVKEQEYELVQVETPKAEAGQVLVKIIASGVCRSDCDAHKPPPGGAIPIIRPLIGGHEGVGNVVAVGEGVTLFKEGDRVGVPFIVGVCGTCVGCRLGKMNHCSRPTMSGFTTHGTWQEYVAADASCLVRIPKAVATEQACPIICAGVTVWNGLKSATPTAGEFIAIPGAGGGLGHLAVQYAKAMGLRVIAIDHGSKEAFVKEQGAEFFVDFTKVESVPGAVNEITGGDGAHISLVVTASPRAYSDALFYTRTLGTLVCIGLAPISAHVGFLALKGIKMYASLVGTPSDAAEALSFVERGLVKCVVEMREMKDIERTLGELEKDAVTGRVVVRVSPA